MGDATSRDKVEASVSHLLERAEQADGSGGRPVEDALTCHVPGETWLNQHLRNDLEEQSDVFQQRLGCLTELKMTWEDYLYKLKVGLQRFKQLDKKDKPECVGSRTR
ncbi:hypothetical protein NDU88_009950 [Pleurodeles waltl]|uniref:Uncharacterized protein n=1 Tax=Pleurodeles waltl TaxID=8319 RepID=A0AAV7Q0T7_PLEWA|nr:hypothetical protein NDU88_009950 [Pleurodeles waltl]